MLSFFQSDKTPLMLAIENNKSLEEISNIKYKKGDINKVNSDGDSALFIAIKMGRCDVVRWLLNNKADMYAGRMLFRPPLQVAAHFAKKDIILMLLDEFKVDINEQSKGGYMKADGSGVAKKFDEKEEGSYRSGGETAIMDAVSSGGRIEMRLAFEIINTLLSVKNINLNLKNEAGDTVLDSAKKAMERYSSYGDIYARCCFDLLERHSLSERYAAKPEVRESGLRLR